MLTKTFINTDIFSTLSILLKLPLSQVCERRCNPSGPVRFNAKWTARTSQQAFLLVESLEYQQRASLHQKILKPLSSVSVGALRLLWALEDLTVTSFAVAGVGSSL